MTKENLYKLRKQNPFIPIYRPPDKTIIIAIPSSTTLTQHLEGIGRYKFISVVSSSPTYVAINAPVDVASSTSKDSSTFMSDVNMVIRELAENTSSLNIRNEGGAIRYVTIYLWTDL